MMRKKLRSLLTVATLVAVSANEAIDELVVVSSGDYVSRESRL